MKRSKKYLTLAISILMIVATIPVSANNTTSIDDYLLSLGVPQTVLNTMTQSQKLWIYDSVDADAEFVSYTEQGYVVSDENNMQSRGMIPSSDLTLSVTAFLVNINGEDAYYAIYPSFVWHTLTNISDDAFAFALFPGWEVIPGERNLRVHLSNMEGQLIEHTDLNPHAASSSGYGYVMSNIGMLNLRHEGHAYVHANDTTGNSTHAISMSYYHSDGLHISYSISIGPGNADISGAGLGYDYISDNYDF